MRSWGAVALAGLQGTIGQHGVLSAAAGRPAFCPAHDAASACRRFLFGCVHMLVLSRSPWAALVSKQTLSAMPAGRKLAPAGWLAMTAITRLKCHHFGKIKLS